MSRFTSIPILLVSILLISCDQQLIRQEYDNDPIHVFEALWGEFDQVYALFNVKQVNWDSLYAVYRPQVSRAMTDEQLFSVLTSLLAHLNDNHILLYAEEMEVFRAGSLNRLPAYLNAQYFYFETDLNRYFYVLKNRYLANGFKIQSGEIPCIYGQIEASLTGPSSIGYIHPGNGRQKDIDFIRTAFDALTLMDGLIIDLRFSAGNNTRLATEIGSYAADRKWLFMISKIRNGPDHDDFDEPVHWYLEPGQEHYDGPIVVLTNKHTMGAAEELLLGLDLLPQVTILGDTTAGAFSSVLTRDLPNGWRYTLPKSVVFAHDGTCFEGIGLVPDSVVRNDRNEMLNQIDSPLVAAINHFK